MKKIYKIKKYGQQDGATDEMGNDVKEGQYKGHP